MTNEKNSTICKICRAIKLRIADGNFPNKKDKRWIGESGKQWNGKVCPECYIEQSKIRMRNTRTK